MRGRKILMFTLLVSLLVPIMGNAQEKTRKAERKEKKEKRKSEKTSYLVFEGAPTYSNNQDFSMSNQLYQGPGIGLFFGQYTETPKTIRDWEYVGTTIQAISSQGDVSGFDFTNTVSYGHFFILKPELEKDWRLAVGPKADIFAQGRLVSALGNSQLHWDAMINVGAAGRIDRTFELSFLKKPIQFYGEAYLPLGGYLNRPSFGIPGFDFSDTHHNVFLGKMARLETETGVVFPFGRNNTNLLRVSYNWDFFRFKDGDLHEVTTGRHALNFGLFVRIR